MPGTRRAGCTMRQAWRVGMLPASLRYDENASTEVLNEAIVVMHGQIGSALVRRCSAGLVGVGPIFIQAVLICSWAAKLCGI